MLRLTNPNLATPHRYGLRSSHPSEAFARTTTSITGRTQDRIMDSSTALHRALATDKHKERTAHIVWAAHIVSYLTRKRSQPPLHDTNNEPAHHGNGDTDETSDCESDYQTERAVVLSGTRDSVRRKFLDCVAQLLSPCKGWDGVTAAGMREGEHGVVVHVARNDGFMTDQDHADLEARKYCRELEEYLASTPSREEGTLTTASPLTEFEIESINYASSRVDDWISDIQTMIAKCGRDGAWGLQAEPGYETAAAAWTEMFDLLAGSNHRERASERIIETVHQAYKCVSLPRLYGWLSDVFGAKNGVKLWAQLNFIARPILDCRLLRAIATREPLIHRAKISLLPAPLNTVVDSEHVLDIFEAWEQLGLGTPPKSVITILQSDVNQFKEACQESFALHAEMQLVSYYEDRHSARPTLDYFGCSKKTCLLCESFLSALNPLITTRGRHGICYPAWGVPTAGPVSIKLATDEVIKGLVTRIRNFVSNLAHGSRNVTIPFVKQSDVVSHFSQLTLQEWDEKQRQVQLRDIEQSAHWSNMLLSEGKVSDSQPRHRPTEKFEPDDCCVMCNRTPALQCTTCGSTYYCTEDCKMSDLPSHSLLCTEFATQPPRPSNSHIQSHRRAIFFPVDDERPRMIWIPCGHRYDPNDGVFWMELLVSPYLGIDDPKTAALRVEHNPVRDRNLGSGFIEQRLQTEGFCISLIRRDIDERDNSATNQSIQASVRRSCGTMTPRSYRGPMVAIRQRRPEDYEDITLSDLRHLMDYLRSYGDTHVRESIPGTRHRSSTTARGVKICCVGETDLHASEPFVSVDVTIANQRALGPGYISPISVSLGMPIVLWKDPNCEFLDDQPGWDNSRLLSASDNDNAISLCMETDTAKLAWGFAPFPWVDYFGNVFAVRADWEDLAVQDVEMMCYFARDLLRPMFEDVLESGASLENKDDLLDFITWENMLAHWRTRPT
ncbi:hypothetical protein BJX65DRAFT_313664 [Aspergillus insuetus]